MTMHTAPPERSSLITISRLNAGWRDVASCPTFLH